jgi:hypothetical protein
MHDCGAAARQADNKDRFAHIHLAQMGKKDSIKRQCTPVKEQDDHNNGHENRDDKRRGPAAPFLDGAFPIQNQTLATMPPTKGYAIRVRGTSQFGAPSHQRNSPFMVLGREPSDSPARLRTH